MDYAGLRAFVTVAREGNLTRAAERLCLTQPALSLQIKKLQSTLDLVLFERTPRGMRLTDAGRKLLPAAERALAAAAEFDAAATGMKGPLLGSLRIGTILDPEFLRLGAFLGLLAKRYPGLAFELCHGMSGAVLREVELGNLDVAYTLGFPGFPDFHDRFQVVALARFRYRVIAPPGWASQVSGKGWHELAALPWIATPPESIHSRLLARIFSAEGVEQNVVARVDLEPSMLDLVKSGVALALARDSLALRAAHADGVTIADSVAVDAELGFVCRRDRALEPAVTAAMAAVREAWGDWMSGGG
ncbi:transcriptional regulator, LysR family [Modicisalibacter ilicicola DSM 19980]|uniref:Transcriptional regulator, LysR family n=1 Tax=Modicisalibacter ilicicola DSM 19980 TaxID=1121942 RepID=A0A1M5D6A1_9GAMM|nr:LysR family transcriptional regulator [Halomonas ilicicola]SHF62504.1 transcriptional regulator, LysR family [Halomonas ilicicola DSM 19980]